MKLRINDFKDSVEYDIHINANKLSFLRKYDIVELLYEKEPLKIYQLKSDNELAILVVRKTTGSFSNNEQIWDTDRYNYRII